ncbi:hypothetical protein CXF62_09915 [Psychrobacter sp. MES7-P7E]|nr:hypothetical protein CXF62_09915 [Psychrobacter sp. MES7-P7E]
MIKYTRNQQNGCNVMSQYQTNGTVPPSRAQAEIERLHAILSERNQQLQTIEQQITHNEISTKHGRRNTRLLMVLCAILIVALSLGGVA